MKLRTQVHQQALFLVRLHSNHHLVLRVIQQFAEFLESIFLPIKFRMLGFHPGGQVFGGRAIVQLQAVGFEHVTQHRQTFLGPGCNLLSRERALAPDQIAAFPARDVHQVCLIQLLDEITE